MTGPMIFTPEYYERMRQLETRGWWNAGMRDVAEGLIALADLPERGTLIDVGCGSGQTMTWFRGGRPGWSTYGLDVALDGVAVAKHFGERVLAGSAIALPLASGSADLVITLDVLQHLPLPRGDQEALAEMYRVLRPGGHLFVRTNAQAVPMTVDDPVHNFRKYDSRDLVGKLRMTGFEIVRFSRVNALLGLAEIPRELRATRSEGAGYHGLLAEPESGRGKVAALKRAWLGLEGRAVTNGIRFPFGRTHVALCRR